MPLNGDVKTFPLSAIVQMIHDEKKTGMLTVASPRSRCSIYFREGKIIHVRGNRDKELKLGSLLKANNLITEDRLEDMLAVSKAMEKRLGTVLLERNYIDLDKLVSIIHLQFREVVGSMLTWEDAKYSYKDGLDGYSDEIKCEVDPVRLVKEAQRRGEFKGIIPNDQVVFQINPAVDTSKSVHAARDLRILLLLDGRRSVAQIIKETGASRLAVYRSLAKLHAQNAIVRRDAAKGPVKTAGRLELSPITSIYLSLLQLIKADLAEELGDKKATTSFKSSLGQSSHYELFLKDFQLDQDLATNVGKMQALIQQQGQALSQQDLINGFNQVVVGLLGEQYQFLGHKATRSTVQRLRSALENAPAAQRQLAQAISRFLQHYEKEDFLRGAKQVAGPAAATGSSMSKDRTPALTLNNMSGSAIVKFYNDMFQMVLTDLENVVGAKAQGLFQGLVRSSKHSETLTSQFDVESAAVTNPLRLRENIKTEELKPSKQELVQTLQLVLRGLLLEESRLLGPKATDLTIARLVERAAAAHTQFKPLADQISASMASKSVKTGG